ncbi:hypothetical protein [Zobellia barbeyronii]|uniref:Uncharacterized protein n=1 Tax=Zobellia barbeyronii TaxID=2748009 RepID=A0ABS5WBM2_9FLAO|nr:hypothetical protein [Zobellia barbeyronii]MBT2160801.1 hypothetical protein [Zobellia barbeyronii]
MSIFFRASRQVTNISAYQYNLLKLSTEGYSPFYTKSFTDQTNDKASENVFAWSADLISTKPEPEYNQSQKCREFHYKRLLIFYLVVPMKHPK